MCLTKPKKIVARKDNFFVLEGFDQEKQEARSVVKNLKVGDWVLTQGGIIVKKMSKKEAQEISFLIKKGARA